MLENKLNGYSENLSEEEISLRVEFVRRVQLISRDMGASDENIVDTMLLFGTVVLSAYQDEDYSDFISGGFRYSYEGFDFSRLIHVSLERSSFPEEYREAIRDFFNTSERLHQIKQNLFNAYVSLFHDLGLYRNSELIVLVDILDYFLFQNRKEISGPFLLNPRLSKLIIEQADINPGDRVHDFSAGYGDLLIQADNLFQEKQRNSYWGCCKYLRNYVIAYLRSMLRNAQNTSFELRNIFEDSNCHYTKELFDVVLSAPPLGLKFTQDDRHRYWDYQYKTSDYTGLYIQQSLRQLKQDGRLVLLVPWNFLCTQKKSDVGFRRWLLENYCVERVIALFWLCETPLRFTP
jgi:type I restriction-modification system DNA methylase subunit